MIGCNIIGQWSDVPIFLAQTMSIIRNVKIKAIYCWTKLCQYQCIHLVQNWDNIKKSFLSKCTWHQQTILIQNSVNLNTILSQNQVNIIIILSHSHTSLYNESVEQPEALILLNNLALQQYKDWSQPFISISIEWITWKLKKLRFLSVNL